MSKSIAVLLYEEADELLHQDLHDFASMLINESNNNKWTCPDKMEGFSVNI